MVHAEKGYYSPPPPTHTLSEEMGIDFVELEFWTYGFAGGLFTYSVFPTYGVMAMLWFGAVFMGIHLEDKTIFLIDFHTWPFVSISCGLAVGLSLAWLLRLQVLVDTTIRNTRNVKRNWAPEFSILVLGSILLTLAFYYLNGNMSDGDAILSFMTARQLGFAMLAAGAIVIVFWFYYCFWSRGDRFNKVMNGKYGLVVSVLLAVAPSVYDFIHNYGFSPHHVWATLVAIVLQWIGIYLILGYVYFYKNSKGRHRPTCGGAGFFGGYTKKKNGKKNSLCIDRLMSGRQLTLLVILGGISQFLVYVVAGPIDVITGAANVPPVVAAIGGVSALLVAAFVFAGSREGTLKYLFGRDYLERIPWESENPRSRRH